MHQTDRSRILVLGVGSSYRSDDRAGFEVVERLTSRGVGEDVSLRRTSDPGTVLLSMSERPEKLVIVDAVRGQSTDGLVRLEDPDPGELSETAFCSTHQLGVEDGIGLGQSLDMLPDTVILYGIPGEDFSHGSRLSETTEALVERTVDDILTNLKKEVT